MPLSATLEHSASLTAATWLVDMTCKHPGEITIIAIGPLTNLALAQKLDPQFAGRIKELVYQGAPLARGRACTDGSF